jgi:hypothetical protein
MPMDREAFAECPFQLDTSGNDSLKRNRLLTEAVLSFERLIATSAVMDPDVVTRPDGAG